MIEAPTNIEKRLKQIHNFISRMPSLSTTATKVLEICNSPNSSPNDLNRVISLDPVLTGQVLKLINSAYYALPNQINSITRAIIMLGINTVKNLALSAAVLDGLGLKESSQSSMYDFWNHSICVGVTAKSIAAVKGIPMSAQEEYFVAGLLHDLGKIPINSRFPDEYVSAQALIKNENMFSHKAEKMIFGIDHCTVGGMIADKWKLSRAMIDSLSHHHDPNEADEENTHLISIVALGNIYANIVDTEISEAPASDEPILNSLLEEVGVSWVTLSDLHEAIIEEIEKARIFLQITQKG
jgi:putative nucleotidyltransferase with HDIG domain